MCEELVGCKFWVGVFWTRLWDSEAPPARMRSIWIQMVHAQCPVCPVCPVKFLHCFPWNLQVAALLRYISEVRTSVLMAIGNFQQQVVLATLAHFAGGSAEWFEPQTWSGMALSSQPDWRITVSVLFHSKLLVHPYCLASLLLFSDQTWQWTNYEKITMGTWFSHWTHPILF